jgi:hypothetical protein
MGQYYLVINLDKRQYLNPHACGEAAGLMDFASNVAGTMTALALLLNDRDRAEPGDSEPGGEVHGSWSGDRVVIVGDYGPDGRYTDRPDTNLYFLAASEFTDISQAAMRAVADYPFWADVQRRRLCWVGDRRISVYDAVTGTDDAVGC